MLQASVDIGTNTVLLLVAEKSGGKLKLLHEEQRMPRLGKRVDANKNLHEESMKRVIHSLKEYHRLLADNFPAIVNPPIVTATSAVRDAPNKGHFLRAVEDTTGWRVKVLSGEDEAQTTYRGALSVLNPELLQGRHTLVLDIGGGSTEFALGESGRLLAAQSLDMGSVRYTERYFRSQIPTEEEMVQVADAAQVLMQNLSGHLETGRENLLMVGVAGTITSIAAIEAGLSYYEANRLNGMILPYSAVQKYRRRFESLSPSTIEKEYASFLTGRGEVITAGLIILEEAMAFYNKRELIVSTGGIRHGSLLHKRE